MSRHPQKLFSSQAEGMLKKKANKAGDDFHCPGLHMETISLALVQLLVHQLKLHAGWIQGPMLEVHCSFVGQDTT